MLEKSYAFYKAGKVPKFLGVSEKENLLTFPYKKFVSFHFSFQGDLSRCENFSDMLLI